MKYIIGYTKEKAKIYNEEGHNISTIVVKNVDIDEHIENALKTIKFFDGRAEFCKVESDLLVNDEVHYISADTFKNIWGSYALTLDKITSNEQGVCPFCGGRSLEYDCCESLEGYIYYPWHCPNCEHGGAEYYETSFAGHNVYDKNGDEVEITEDMIERG